MTGPQPPAGDIRRLDVRAVVPLLVLAQIASLQIGSAVAKAGYEQVSPLSLAGMRIAFAAAIMCAWIRPRPRQLAPRQWRAAIGLGLVIAAMNAAYFLAIERLPIGVASTLELLGPLLLSVSLSRRTEHAVIALLAVAGVLLIALPVGELPAFGIALGAFAAACRAAYVILGRRVGQLFPDWVGLTVALVVGACVLAPVALIADGSAIAGNPAIVWRGLAVAVLSSLVPYSLDMTVLRRIDVRTFGVLLSLSPVVGAVVALLTLDEQLSLRQACAIGLVILASAWAAGRAGPSNRSPAPPGGPAGTRPRTGRPEPVGGSGRRR